MCKGEKERRREFKNLKLEIKAEQMNEFKKNCNENNNRGKNPMLFELGKEMNFKFQICHQIS